jgi:7-carboxy-7-deazaguanine synthase (Cx14CxxC type)
MSYSVKEVFYTIQGEGLNIGRPAVFLRFSGCNLWSGREQDRATGKGGCSRWCDTDFVGTDGTMGGRYPKAEVLASVVEGLWPLPEKGRPLVVCTGGEPLLQLDLPLLDALHTVGFEIAIESNGTLPIPVGVDWVCISPKAGSTLVVDHGDELKLVFPQKGCEPPFFEQLRFRHFLLQPMDGPNLAENTQRVLKYCLAHPQWRVSVQAHKHLGIR